MLSSQSQSTLIVLLAFVAIAAASIDFTRLLEKVPENDRLNYLKYHINLGYSLQTQRVYKPSPRLSNEFSIALYEYAKANHKIGDEDVLKQTRELICFDNGDCFDLGDVGIHPKETRKIARA